MGYACCFALQEKLRGYVYHMHPAKDETSAEIKLYGFAVSLVYFGNLFFRMQRCHPTAVILTGQSRHKQYKT